jgi:BON domain
MRRFFLIIVVLVTIASLPNTAAAQNLSQSARAQIENNVVREIAPTVGVFDYVSFQLDASGAVTLYGQVRDPNLKTHAAEDAKKVEGVKRVQNNIEVLPISPSDDEIRRAVYLAVYRQPGFEKYSTRAVPPIHIIVKNGAVSLEGFVASKVEFAQAKTAAANVPGTFNVTNHLRIEGGE